MRAADRWVVACALLALAGCEPAAPKPAPEFPDWGSPSGPDGGPVDPETKTILVPPVQLAPFQGGCWRPTATFKTTTKPRDLREGQPLGLLVNDAVTKVNHDHDIVLEADARETCGQACFERVGSLRHVVEADGVPRTIIELFAVARQEMPTPEELSDLAVVTAAACLVQTGGEIAQEPWGVEWRLPAPRTVEELLQTIFDFEWCIAEGASAANTYDGTDSDLDVRDDACDNCPDEPNPEQADSGGLWLGDACECQNTLDNTAERDRECVVQPDVDNGRPGLLGCGPDDPVEPHCEPTGTWARHDQDFTLKGFLSAGPEGGNLPPDGNYRIDPDECEPEGAICAGPQRMQWKEYEDYVCAQMLAQNKPNREHTVCRLNSGPGERPWYRTEAITVSLPPQLDHVLSEQVILPEGRVRYPDYIVNAPHHVVLGEAKCYNRFVQWNSTAKWQWKWAIAFAGQLMDYVAKALASRRGGPRYSVRYHWCDGPPGWAGTIMAAAIASAQAEEINEQSLERDSPLGVNWANLPVCWHDALDPLVARVLHQFECWMPGEEVVAQPVDLCLGAFYDDCHGSE